MATEVRVPDFNFTGYYYAQWLDALISYMRQNVPSITDENPYEPFIQLLRAFALVGHYNGVLIDITAREVFLPTARIFESFTHFAALTGYDLRLATPAQARLIARLTRTFSTPTLLIPTGALFATEATGTEVALIFETQEDVNIERTDEINRAFSEEAGAYSANNAANVSTSGPTFTPWATPAAGDKLYLAHSDILLDKLRFTLTTPGADLIGVWEYYDGEWRDNHPGSVTNLGASLEFNLNDLLGTSDRSGATVRVEYAPTGAFEDVVTTYSGGVNKATTGFLGQTMPSTDANDYVVGALWKELDPVTDGTNGLTQSGDLDFTVPEEDWQEGSVNSLGGYYIRYRIISVGGAPVSPVIDLVEITEGNQYVAWEATQGQTVTDDPLGSSTGEPNQVFILSRSPVAEGEIVVEVDEGAGYQVWTEVDSFINSTPASRHFRKRVDAEDAVSIIFGDGDFGKIPQAGADNIRATYRIDASDDGNVGARTITVNRTGVAYIASVRNPLQATGWKPRDGADDAALNQLRILIPADLRTLGRAITPADAEYLANQWIDSDGTSPVVRSLAIEEAFGPKTIEIVVVGSAGGLLTADQRGRLETYFNGDPEEDIDGVLVMNHEATVTNYEPKTIDIDVEVEGGSQTAVETAVAALISPLALKADGTYQWEFGGEVPRSQIIAAIHESDPAIVKVNLITPATDVSLATRELPTLGTLTVTMI